MDLQIAVLRNLPTPIIVLSPLHITVFVNRASERILGSPNYLQSIGSQILGRSLAELGIRLLYNRTWEVILDKLASAEGGSSAGTEISENDRVHEADVLLENTHLDLEDRHFRILMSTIMTEQGMHYILSLERSAHIPKQLKPSDSDSRPPDEAISVTPKDPIRDSVTDSPRDIFGMKKAVFDSSNVMGFILTADEKFYLTNKKTREVLGDAMGGAEGCDGPTLRASMAIWDEKFTRQLDAAEYPGISLVRSKKPFNGHRYGFTQGITGDKLVMNMSGECLYDDDTGEFLGGLCWCHDVQEYSDFVSDQQNRLLRSHETICDLMPHLVWTTTPEGLVDWYSRRWYDFTGLTPEESLGDGFRRAVHHDDLPRLLEKWEYHRGVGNECEIEVRYRRNDGLYRWMLVRACPLRDELGSILKWYGTTTDIHDLVVQRIEAARNRLQMLTVLAHAEVNLFSINKDRIIEMAEGGMHWDSETKLYDVQNKSTLVGKDAIEVAKQTQPGGIPGYEKNILDVLSGIVEVAQSEDVIGGRVYRTRVVADLEHDTEDGGRKPELRGVLGLSLDITDLKARAALSIENARLTIEEQAAKDSNRMKSQFLANMSHELRTPTAGVIGMAELIGDDPKLTNEQRDYINSIQLSAKALLTIVNDILDFSKIESGRLDIEQVPFNLAAVTGELCKLLGMFAQQKGLEFMYENSMESDLELVGDPGRVRQVLSNLLTNALKFTREGFVKLAVSTTTQSILTINKKQTIEVEFLIEDTGIGIEPEVLDKLFKPFSQGDSSTARLYGGTGLGLTISKNLASLMHGSIDLESTPGVGSKATFTVPFEVSSWHQNPYVPSSSPPNPGFRYHIQPTKNPTWTLPPEHRATSQDLLNQQISSSVTEYIPPPLSRSRHGSVASLSRDAGIDTITNKSPDLTPEQRSKLHVLVVEDNAINQTIAIKNIRKLGFPVTAVWNGREALSYLRFPSPTQPRPAIILMDVQMPVMDGYEATRILRTSKGSSDFTLDNVTEGRRMSVTLDGMDADRIERGKMGLMDAVENFGQASVGDGGGEQELKDIPVIAMTASAIQGDRERCHDAGMDDYLSKPVDKTKLEEMLVKWAGKRRR